MNVKNDNNPRFTYFNVFEKKNIICIFFFHFSLKKIDFQIY